MRILHVASECAPLAKVGGLADVAAALPKALRARHHDARVLLPLYGERGPRRDELLTRLRAEHIGSACVHLGTGIEIWVGLHEARLPGPDQGVPLWLIEHEGLYGRRGVYDEGGVPYPDNALRFALLSKAALQICKDRAFVPDVIHSHDWPTSLCGPFLKTWDRILSPLSHTASVLTIHNAGYQGHFSAAAYPMLGIGPEHFHEAAFEDHGGINLLKAGIMLSDALSTVSPRYARELMEPAHGFGLSEYIRHRAADFVGILNGADYDQWDPRHDPLITAAYTPENLSGKAVCQAALRRRLGLSEEAAPLVGIVTRFAEQKGTTLMRDALPAALSQMHLQLAVLGSGDPAMEAFFSALAHSHPGRVGCQIGYSEELSHLIQAGCDLFLMPSLYEPCGLTQMYALRYGTLPIVRATGGLDDTVLNYDEHTGHGTGFKFDRATPRALFDTIGWAISTYYDRPGHFDALRRRAMSQTFSWDDAAARYVGLYDRACQHRRAQG